MNNSINHSGFVDLFLDSLDDYEPYGYGEPVADYEKTSTAGKIRYGLEDDLDFGQDDY